MTKQCLSGKYLWKCGRQSGFACQERGSLVLDQESGRGIFISRVYDSGMPETEWNRLILDMSGGAVFQVDVYVFEEEGERDRLEQWEGVAGIPEQHAYLRKRAQYSSHYREMLLYGKKQGVGRFAVVALEILNPGKGEGGTKREHGMPGIVLSGYALSFPKESFTRYLPSLYRGNLQLERFLAVQQSVYLDLEHRIDGIARELDYERCEGRQAERLAKWMGWGGLADMVGEDVLRKLLAGGISLIRRKGTRSYYEELTKILTGQDAILLEEPGKRECMLLVKGKPSKSGEKCLKWLCRNVPIGIHMTIVILHRTDRLDVQCFLDVTSFLSEYESRIPGQLDRLRLL